MNILNLEKCVTSILLRFSAAAAAVNDWRSRAIYNAQLTRHVI